jgi:hypothetical protein
MRLRVYGGRKSLSVGCATDAPGGRTENEFLRRRQHVQGECDFVLVALALEPAEHGGWVEHGGEEQCGCAGEEDKGCKGCRIDHELARWCVGRVGCVMVATDD